MLSEFNVTINFFELFAKKFAKTGENRLFNNKKTLKSALYKAFFESFKFQTGTIYICTIELISKNFNFKKINTMNNRQEIERVSRSCRFYF